MSDDSSIVTLADSISDLANGIAGWLLVALGAAGFLNVTSAVFGNSGLSTNPLVMGFVLLFSLTLVTFGVFVNPRFRRRLNRRHSVDRFGTVRTVDNRVVRAEENCRERCVACDSRVEQGVVRRLREEYVVAGVPVYTDSESYNHYCRSCALSELSPEVGGTSADSAGDRDTDAEMRTGTETETETAFER
ncbi:hypothetical protein AUR64_12425 [Haloprofundus marisrubri]|uniref:DUF8108 domain-containing protein n=1 Tax=Haloprofundus marisrubri TaxID=1514971 RepID=A0A0W1RAP6_9EURY|nr:hypothetical protein [Haloprofundus marisrubri]KTG10368.1 hypothetical protein AUR64_12425 [Haloprofundus marisrubri]